MAQPERFRGKKVGLVLCGGNIDPRILASIMVRELERETRIVSFRLTIPDRPGVLGEIAGVLGKHGISIASVIQHETTESDRRYVPLVIMTHTATEGAARSAVEAIDKLPSVRSGSVRMRVRD